MGSFVKGDVAVVPFPFSDLTRAKRRPALVIAELEGDDLILCQITSQSIKDRYAVSIDESDFKIGTLRRKSNVRPNRIFTADYHIILYRAGHLKPQKIDQVIKEIVDILRPNI
ncbi:MAG: type II toxin-antitoxin system PemK/MazF family toxin [Candidatus Omnitrophica bacterium]|nr:type II toxin-antitoxin system PemK/MazF family toxin [Candidatus Omnitrophota bacterium]